MNHLLLKLITFFKNTLLLLALALSVVINTAFSHDYRPTAEFRGYTNIDDVRLYYEVHGEGEPLLLLHGGMLSGAESWSRVLPLLPKGYKVIIPDSRAHGRSTDSVKPLSYELLTDNIIELLDRLDVDNVHIVGWSDGGVIGLDIAMRYPDRIVKLIAYGTNFHFDGIPNNVKDEMKMMTGETRPKWIADLTYLNIAPDPSKMGVMVKKVTDMWLTEPQWDTKDLAIIEAPVLILEDEIGKAILPTHTREMVSSIKGAKLTLISETDHFAPQTKAEEFAELISKFLMD